MKVAAGKAFSIVLVMVLIFSLPGCSKKIIRSLQKGSIGVSDFHKVIDAEYQLGLLIVPVIIQGKIYRFIFDSGAPLCISEYIQEINGFKKITAANLTDSDGAASNVDIVKIDSILIDGIPFVDQSAFVLNMQAHPLINCLDVDGIIGSNLMRLCNWKINIEERKISLSDNMKLLENEDATILPFTTDFQYNIYLNLGIDNLNFGGFELDYGSTGYLSVLPRQMRYLVDHEIIDTVFKDSGYRQAGILGNKRKAESEIAYTNKIFLDKLPLDSIEIRTSQNQLIGTALLRHFEVGIDWKNRVVHFTKLDSTELSLLSIGLTLGYTYEGGFYIMRVMEGSPAFKAGIRPDMKVIEIDSINLVNPVNYCKHIEYWSINKDSLAIKCENSLGEVKSYTLKSKLPHYW